MCLAVRVHVLSVIRRLHSKGRRRRMWLWRCTFSFFIHCSTLVIRNSLSPKNQGASDNQYCIVMNWTNSSNLNRTVAEKRLNKDSWWKLLQGHSNSLFDHLIKSSCAVNLRNWFYNAMWMLHCQWGEWFDHIGFCTCRDAVSQFFWK